MKNFPILLLSVLLVSVSAGAEGALAELPFVLLEEFAWGTYQELKKNIVLLSLIVLAVNLIFYAAPSLRGTQDDEVHYRWVDYMNPIRYTISGIGVLAIFALAFLNVSFQGRIAREKHKCETSEGTNCNPELNKKIQEQLAVQEGMSMTGTTAPSPVKKQDFTPQEISLEQAVAERTWKKYSPTGKPWPKKSGLLENEVISYKGQCAISIINKMVYPVLAKIMTPAGEVKYLYIRATDSASLISLGSGAYSIRVIYLQSEQAYELPKAEFIGQACAAYTVKSYNLIWVSAYKKISMAEF